MRILLTGATGVVGSELLIRLRRTPDVEVTAVCATKATDGIVAWPMGKAPAPFGNDGRWDVVIHAAADTRWNLSPDDAVLANVASTASLREILERPAHVLFVSTLYATGLRGDGQSADLSDYRNTYEWSKAAAERMVVADHQAVTIVRIPMIIGRRVDGHIARFVGLYTLMKAAFTGLAPLIVAEPDGYLELAPVDDVAEIIINLCLKAPPTLPRIVEVGRGRSACSVRETLSIVHGAINNWRQEHGVPGIEYPPLVTPQRWKRFFLPLAQSHLSDRQRRMLDSLSYFMPYLSIRTPFNPSVLVEDTTVALKRAIGYWLERNPAVALGSPQRWRLEEGFVP